jgi:hypothetical protein
MAERLVPMLCVGIQSSTLCVVRSRLRAAERPGRYSHAERGNESNEKMKIRKTRVFSVHERRIRASIIEVER